MRRYPPISPKRQARKVPSQARPLVSVIVPVYKTEKCISKCIDSFAPSFCDTIRKVANNDSVHHAPLSEYKHAKDVAVMLLLKLKQYRLLQFIFTSAAQQRR